MSPGEGIDGDLRTRAKGPAHDAYKGGVGFCQENYLLRHGVCVLFVVTGVCDQETDQGSARKLGTIVELFLRYVGALYIIMPY